MAGVQTFGRVHVPPDVTVHSFGRSTTESWHNNTPDEENLINAAAVKGAAIAASNGTIAAARALHTSPAFKRGFDVATAICQGSAIPGSGQDRYREMSSGTVGMSAQARTDAQDGFNVGQALQHGITKSGGLDIPPDTQQAAGFLATTGIAGSTSSQNVKTGVMKSLTADPSAVQGASAAIKVHQGFFHRILAFFGL